MDCDDVMLLVAVGEGGRTLSGGEESMMHAHVAGCDACRAVIAEASGERPRSVVRVASDAFDDPDLLVLPAVDPIMFAMGAELAHGGMGRITRARDRRLGREVAIKEVLVPSMRARFEREAMITARLQHPAIVPVYEAGTWPDGSAFYTMRLVAGGTLSDAIGRADTLEARLALLPHVVALTEALAYAHARRVVHRDLKPANVLVGEFGETVVIDWGLAKELAVDADGPADAGGAVRPSSPELTTAGSIVGTPCFIAPEQAAGDPIDERADVYALGAILYNLLTGEPPHWDTPDRSAERLIAAALTRPPTPIAQLAPRAPLDLRVIVERAMARDPDDRFPSAKEMADELRRFQTGQLLGSRAYTRRELLARWLRRHRTPVTVAAIAFAVLTIVGAVSVWKIVVSERVARASEQAALASEQKARKSEEATQRTLAASQLDQGRQLIVDGDITQAMPYLAAALAALPDDPLAHRLAALALRDVPRRLARFEGTAAAFNPVAPMLAIGHADGSIAWIDASTAKRVGERSGIAGRITALTYSSDGQQLAVIATSGDPPKTKSVAYTLDVQAGTSKTVGDFVDVREVRFLPDRRLAIACAKTVAIIDARGVAHAAPASDPHGLVVSADGSRLVALLDNRVLEWRIGSGSELSAAPIEMLAKHAIYMATWDHDDVITAGMDGVVRWRAGRQVHQYLSRVINTLSVISSRRLLADGTLIDLDTGVTRRLGRLGAGRQAVADEGRVITGRSDRTLQVWDLERGAQPMVVLEAEVAANTLLVGASGRRAVSRGAEPDAPVELWNIELPSIARLDLKAPINKLVAEGDRLAVQIAGEKTRLIDTGSGRPRSLVPIGGDATLAGWPLKFWPGHHKILTGAWDGKLHIHSSLDGKHERDVNQETLHLTCDPPANPDRNLWNIGFSESGSMIAIASERCVWLFDDQWRRIGPQFEVGAGHPDISSVAIDGRGHLVTGYQDGTMTIWDTETGKVLAAFTGHNAQVTALEIRDDEVVSSSWWDPMLRSWAVPSGAPRGEFKKFDDISIAPNQRLFAVADGTPVLSLEGGAQNRLVQQVPTTTELWRVVFLDDDHVVVAGESQLELVELRPPAPPQSADELRSRLENASRWRLVDGRLVEREAAAQP